MKTNPPATDSCLQRPLRRCRHIPQHATDSRKPSPYFAKLTGTSTPSQITLYCRLLHISNISPLDWHVPIDRRFTTPPKMEGGRRMHCGAALICLTAQEGGDVEQIFFLAQARPVVRLKRGQPRLRDLLCRLGSR